MTKSSGKTGRTILAGMGAGVLFTLAYTCALLSPDHLLIYHSRLPMPSVAGGLLIDFAVAALLGAGILFYLGRTQSGELHLGWAVIAACLALVAVAVVTEVLGVPDRHRYLIRAAGGVLLLSLACRWLWPPAYRVFSRGLMLLFLLAGVSAFWVVPELVYLMVARSYSPPAADSTVSPATGEGKVVAAQGGRIVWVIFDELSYDQIFDHPSPTVPMPAFDRLGSESIGFSDLQPAGYFTDHVIPSLFLGAEIESLRSDMRGWPEVRIAGERRWGPFQPRASIFGFARAAGWTTGVAGWYNPYCRILAGELNSCHAVVNNLEANGMSPGNSALKNALLPIAAKLGRYFPLFGSGKPASLPARHRSDYEETMSAARRLLQNESIGLVFLHLPIPHPPGIYDRRTGQLRNGGDYLDNLALADRVLGELRETLAATASASQTILIVCSDHSWRVNMWKQWPGWTREEEEATGGRFDPRPVLLIHFPGQASRQVVTRPFPEIRLHKILLEMIDGRIKTKEDFDQWLAGETTPDHQRSSVSDVVAGRGTRLPGVGTASP